MKTRDSETKRAGDIQRPLTVDEELPPQEAEEKEDIIIKLPADGERLEFLRGKLNEYQSRKLELDKTNDKENKSALYRRLILEELLSSGEVNVNNFFKEMPEKTGVDAPDKAIFEEAASVIYQYVYFGKIIGGNKV